MSCGEGAGATAHRRDADAGSCYTDEYREGARFLLLLTQKPDGSLTPYWRPLAPINEQLHTGSDPWLTTVRRFATAAARR
jgi:hypothetical protein